MVQWPPEMDALLMGTQVGSLWLDGFLLSFEFAPVISHSNLRGLVCLMGGDLIMQKKGEAVAPKVKSLSVLAPALGCGTPERLKPWPSESGKYGGTDGLVCGLDGATVLSLSSFIYKMIIIKECLYNGVMCLAQHRAHNKRPVNNAIMSVKDRKNDCFPL